MKPYVKPALFYESYELSEHIAACRWDVQFDNEYSCYAVYDPSLTNKANQESIKDDPGNRLFSNDQCDFGPESLEGYCYMNGSENTNRAFQS